MDKKRENLGIPPRLLPGPDPARRAALHEAIKAFNDAQSPPHRAWRARGRTPLELYLLGDEDTLLGGLSADTYWEWLDIDDLWLAPALRGQGVGRQLLALAEEEAVARGCRWAVLKTFSFQARGFYERCGYRVVGELTDYPPGGSFFWMRKTLRGPDS